MIRTTIVALCLNALFTLTAQAELKLPTWANKFEGKFSVGVVAGQEFRYTKEFIEDDFGNLIGEQSQFKAQGVVTVGVLKYALLDYFDLIAGYGLAQRKLLQGNQVVITGIEYVDFIGITLFGGFDVGACGPNGCGSGKVVNALHEKERWFIAIGLVFSGFEFKFNDLLQDEDATTLLGGV